MMALFSFFSGSHTVILAWLCLSTLFFCIVFVMKIALRVNRYVWIPIYLCHCALNLAIATHFTSTEGLGWASIIVIMAESIRMLMKAHSYIRTKLLYLKKNPYKDFEFRGIRVGGEGSEDSQKEIKNESKVFKISIKESDVFG